MILHQVRVLEFYSVDVQASARIARSGTLPMSSRALASIVIAMLVATGCATAPERPAPSAPTAPPLPRTAPPPPPPVNLTGFPLPYRQGFADGCASASAAERKDGGRYADDPVDTTPVEEQLWEVTRRTASFRPRVC